MNQDQKVQMIVERIQELFENDEDQLKEIAREYGTQNIGYANFLGSYDTLKLLLEEIQSGEIFEDK